MEKDYLSGIQCISYINSTNETWKQEAIKFNTWRDSVWQKFYNIETFTDDFDSVLTVLPELNW